ncbi:ACT domain-containing protein [Arthrobacter sp. NPDC092385]|uniref:ACT domain-containing protein n=1 Tax=Arthrobacter sp. NPDC092385 TaxID=3363943 RepID=UPI003825A414
MNNDSAPSVALRLTLLPEDLSVYRYPAEVDVRELDLSGRLWSVTRTPRELSVVGLTGTHPDAEGSDPGWRCLYVGGPIPFDLAGVVAGLTATIAALGLPVFVLSTFDSDLLLLRADSLPQSLKALRAEGYVIDS